MTDPTTAVPPVRRCATHDVDARLRATDPAYARAHDEGRTSPVGSGPRRLLSTTPEGGLHECRRCVTAVCVVDVRARCDAGDAPGRRRAPVDQVPQALGVDGGEGPRAGGCRSRGEASRPYEQVEVEHRGLLPAGVVVVAYRRGLTL